jgi:hypothetical protein
VKQPALGVVSSVLVIVVSLAFISIFSVAAFTTWVAFLMICLIPMVVVISVTWGGKNPGFAARRSQPAKGALFMVCVLAAGAVVALVHFTTVGGSISPPTPVLSMCIITTVIITFWLTIIWGGWPFTTIIKSPVVAGLTLLVASYVVNYLLFRMLFNFPGQVPHGLFMAWNALVGYVTVIGGMFLVLGFELWPLSRRPALVRQPVLGLIWTGIVLVVGAAALFVGEGLFGVDAPLFMVRVPIPFVFGTIIVMNMFQNSLFARFTQPLRGVLNTIASAVIGVGLSRLYGVIAPILSGPVPSGGPGYTFEVWLASALLAVTFPLLVINAELFQFWPLSKQR